jgi:CcmD family protein
VTNLWYLFAAYTAVFAGIALYVARLGRRTRELEREIESLRERLTR